MPVLDVSEDDCFACHVRDTSSRDVNLPPLAPRESRQTECSNAVESRASSVAKGRVKHRWADHRIWPPSSLHTPVQRLRGHKLWGREEQVVDIGAAATASCVIACVLGVGVLVVDCMTPTRTRWLHVRVWRTEQSRFRLPPHQVRSPNTAQRRSRCCGLKYLDLRKRPGSGRPMLCVVRCGLWSAEL
jgi:hypothetical protein